MFVTSLSHARTWAAQSGQPYDLVPCGGGHYTVVPSSIADDLYPGRAVYRCEPSGDAFNLYDTGRVA